METVLRNKNGFFQTFCVFFVISDTFGTTLVCDKPGIFDETETKSKTRIQRKIQNKLCDVNNRFLRLR